MQRFCKWLIKKITKDYTKIPLLWVEFNLDKYKQDGTKGSCIIKLHPELKNDTYIKEILNGLVDYIRDNYNMDKLSKY